MRDSVAFLLFVSLLAIVFPKGNQGYNQEEDELHDSSIRNESDFFDENKDDYILDYNQEENKTTNESTESFCRDQFTSFDDNPKDDYIDKEEFGFSNTPEYVKHAFKKFDVDGDGKLNYTESMEECTNWSNNTWDGDES